MYINFLNENNIFYAKLFITKINQCLIYKENQMKSSIEISSGFVTC